MVWFRHEGLRGDPLGLSGRCGVRSCFRGVGRVLMLRQSIGMTRRTKGYQSTYLVQRRDQIVEVLVINPQFALVDCMSESNH
jgi:hypothetical protein